MAQNVSQQTLKGNIQWWTKKGYIIKNKYKKWLKRMTGKQMMGKDHKILGTSGGKGP